RLLPSPASLQSYPLSLHDALPISQISAFRLTRHHFVDKNLTDLTTVCRNVCGIQSQVMAAAQMAFWARMHGLTRADIRSALWKRDRKSTRLNSSHGSISYAVFCWP